MTFLAYCIRVALGSAALMSFHQWQTVAAQEKPIASIASVIADLELEIGNVLDVSTIRQSKVFARVRSLESELLWNRLLLDEDPMAQYVGLLCFSERRPDRSHLAAARLFLKTERPGSPHMGLAGSILSQPMGGPNQVSEVAELLAASNPKLGNLAVFMGALGEENLASLFDRIDLSKCTAATVAGFVDVISSNSKLAARPAVKGKLLAAIQMISIIPGQPRCIYLGIVEPIPKDFVPLLDSVLDDPSVDDLSILALLVIRGDKYVPHLTMRLPQLSASRQKVIQRYIERQRKKAAEEGDKFN